MESLILYFLYVDNNKILHMNTLLICLPKEKNLLILIEIGKIYIG